MRWMVFCFCFSFQCRKTKTKVITPSKNKKRKQHEGPIRIRSRCMQPASSAGKHVQPCHDWFLFSLQHKRPIRIRSRCMQPASSAGKHVQPCHWFLFCFSLVEKLARVFFNQSQNAVKQNQSNYQITFDTQFKTAIMYYCHCKALRTSSGLVLYK